MKVAILSPVAADARGGVASFVRGLHTALQSHGVDSRLFAAIPRLRGIHLQDLARAIVADPALTADLRAFKPDVVHANANWRLAAWAEVAWAPQVCPPLIFTFHTSPAGRVLRLRAKALTRILQHCDQLTAVSRFLGEEVSRRFAGALKVDTLYPGFVPPEPARGSDPETEAESIRIATVSQMSWAQKTRGILLLIDAVDRLREHGFRATLSIFGDGPYRSMVKRHIRGTKAESWAALFGYSNDLADRLQGHRIFAHITFQESFGFSILEAMSLGIPVVASRVGGIPEVVEDRVSGIMVENRVDAIEAGLRLILSDSGLAHEVSKRGRSRCGGFSWSQRIGDHIATYERLAQIRE